MKYIVDTCNAKIYFRSANSNVLMIKLSQIIEEGLYKNNHQFIRSTDRHLKTEERWHIDLKAGA